MKSIFLSWNLEALPSDHSVLLVTSSTVSLFGCCIFHRFLLGPPLTFLVSFWHFFFPLSTFTVKFCWRIFMMAALNYLSNNMDLCDTIGSKSVIGWKMGRVYQRSVGCCLTPQGGTTEKYCGPFGHWLMGISEVIWTWHKEGRGALTCPLSLLLSGQM